MARLRITQVRSTIRTKPEHKGTMRALGLRKINASTERDDSPVHPRHAAQGGPPGPRGGDRWLTRPPDSRCTS